MTGDGLRVDDLHVYYDTPSGPIKAVNGISFALKPGDRFGLVGESGSGKSTTVLAILRLIKPPGMIRGGTIRFGDISIRDLSEDGIKKIRLAQIALIPQGAMNSLNPVMRVRDQIIDGVHYHANGTSKREITERLPELVRTVGLDPHVLDLFPHELSGGMKQRVCIAIGISLQPKVIIADEPTSALDVVVQRQIMQTLSEVQTRLGASVLLVGHDMGLMAQFVDRIGVMYGGRLVEVGPVRDVFKAPLHPYTQLLISSLPSVRTKRASQGIPGSPPSLLRPPPGCVFHPRCPRRMEKCSAGAPELRELRPGHQVACYLYDDAD